MKYVLKNLVSFMRTEKMIFVLVIICIITSSFIINFSYGLYQNYNVVKEEAESGVTEIYIPVNNSEFVTKGRLRECSLSVSGSVNDNIIMYYASVVSEPAYEENGWGGIDVRFTVRDNNIYPCEVFADNLSKNGNLISGSYFSPEQEKNGENVAIVRIPDESNPNDCTSYITTRVEGNERWVEVQGKEYKVIGYHQQLIAPYIPFESLDDDTQLRGVICIQFEKMLSRVDYNEIKTSFEMFFGDYIEFPDLDIPEAENYYFYNTIILISVMIAVLAAVNFAVLYRYILTKRIKTLAVFRICGCTKNKVLGMFLAECLLITVPVFIASALIYDKFILPELGRHYEYIISAYSPVLYLIIFSIYIISSVIVLFLMINFSFLNKTILETKGEN